MKKKATHINTKNELQTPIKQKSQRYTISYLQVEQQWTKEEEEKRLLTATTELELETLKKRKIEELSQKSSMNN